MPHCAPRAATAGSDAHAATLPVLDFSIAESLRAALVHSRYSRAHPAMPCPHPVTPSRLSRRVNNRSLPKSSACNTTEKQSGGEETASRRAHSALRRALSSSAACSAAAMSAHRFAFSWRYPTHKNEASSRRGGGCARRAALRRHSRAPELRKNGPRADQGWV